jgi:hypothetical protein
LSCRSLLIEFCIAFLIADVTDKASIAPDCVICQDRNRGVVAASWPRAKEPRPSLVRDGRGF